MLNLVHSLPLVAMPQTASSYSVLDVQCELLKQHLLVHSDLGIFSGLRPV